VTCTGTTESDPVTTTNFPGPGGYGGPGGPRRSSAFVPLIVVGAAVSVIALIGIVVVGVRLAGGGSPSGGPQAGSSHGATTSASPSPSPSPSPTNYSSLPDPCSLGSALPQRAASLKASGSKYDTSTDKTCQWQQYTSSRATDLDVTVSLSSDASGAQSTFSEDRSYDKSDTEYKTDLAWVSGLGDTAYGCVYRDDIVYGKSESSAKTYKVGGAKVEVLDGNAIVEVEWAAADYSGSSGSVLSGTTLKYGTARGQAVAIARHVLAGLK
jgi:hypothetical protein